MYIPLKTRVAILSTENYRNFQTNLSFFPAKHVVRLAKFPQFKEYVAKEGARQIYRIVKSVSSLSTNFVWNIFYSKKNWASFDKKYVLAFM